ncbi:pyridoxal phosphate-dependent aminotransferase [Plasticicumulans acidivorans]|uniref:2-keto-4-methylthiobutyrate aminotransferase n=1 Tax=Plasticicumulans acidivorans TaxID=886464 RepID=A0A317MQS9_9GAMM|nr:pyridoxal phosphate-dependent aminotransferase [Plasticicumulans acidivorans]PWV58509.1 2-keto-4-methylthiobutyrate aminotransferase [Plasticicumulans acidivorans]
MIPAPTSRLPQVGTTIFTVMSALAQECGALNLSQGFPDFALPSALTDAVAHHVRAGHNQYAPMAGVVTLREAIATKVLASYGAKVDAGNEVTVTSGATEALFCAIQAIVQPGDEVIVFDPCYDSYEPAVTLAGGQVVHVPLAAPAFCPDWAQVSAVIGPRTRAIILNTPHNPTGSVWSAQDMQQLQQRVRDTNIFLISDEVYEHIVFDGCRHESVLRYPELAARAFVVSSFGKTFHATGWKVGYCIAPSALSAEFRKIHQYVTFSTATPMQFALADFLSACPQHWQTLPAFYQAKRDRFCSLLDGSRFSVKPSSGTYFQLLEYSSISHEHDVALASRLTREAGIASIPVSVFYRQAPSDLRLLRFCFAKDDATLDAAAAILQTL